MQIIIDDYILKMIDTGEDLYGGLLWMVATMAAVFLVGALATLLYNRIIAIIGQKVLKEIRDDLFVKMQTFPIRFFDTHTHGDIMSVYTNDTDTLRQFIAQSLPMMISSLVTIVFAFCFMLRFSLDPYRDRGYSIRCHDIGGKSHGPLQRKIFFAAAGFHRRGKRLY